MHVAPEPDPDKPIVPEPPPMLIFKDGCQPFVIFRLKIALDGFSVELDVLINVEYQPLLIGTSKLGDSIV